MKFLQMITILVWTAMLPAFAASGPTAAASVWEKSVVKVEVSRNIYDYYQPWNRRNDRSAKNGLVVGVRQILTTAQDLSDRTLVRLQKGGRGKWTNAKVDWIDYHANLALLTTDDAAFWTDLQPANLAG